MVEELKKENALLKEQIEILYKIKNTNESMIKVNEQTIRARKELSIEILNQVLEYSAWDRVFKLKSWAKNILNQLKDEQN